ncbi:YqzL family protein [Paenibacillus hamazuiensis]|nr:YqzL family protein [Paenibacillus hamazuiensis]
MRDFSWKYFTMTGDVDAYLLYRQIADVRLEDEEQEEEPGEDSSELVI